jgi:hypothetical protein
MPATRTALSDITPRHRSGAPVIESTYICPFDLEGHALETTAYAWSRYNRHPFREHRDDRMSLYPNVDTVYVWSATWKGSNDTFKDLFLDNMCVFLLLNYFLIVTHHHE